MTKDASAEIETCPICGTPLKERKVFYWIISPPVLSLLLFSWNRLYLELNCCPTCHRNIWRRRWLVLILSNSLPLGVLGAFWLKMQSFPQVREVPFAMALVAAAYAIVVSAFAATGLNRVNVSNVELTRQAKQLARTRLKNSTPWLLPALVPWGAERAEHEEACSSEDGVSQQP